MKSETEKPAREDRRGHSVPNDPALERTLEASIWDGAFYSAMIGLGESYLAPFALALGMNEVLTGQLAVIPILLGSVLQLFAQHGVNRLRSRRKWVVVCASVQAIALVWVAILGLVRGRPEWLFLMATGYWAAGMSAGPAWNAWISTVVPPEMRIHFFARRTRLIQLFTLGGLVSAGIVLYHGKQSTHYIEIFSGLFVLAAFCRAVSTWFLTQQPDTVTHPADAGGRLWPSLAPLKVPFTAAFVVFLFSMNLAVHWSAPYFTPYMLKQLKLDYLSYMFLVSVAFIARVLSYPLLEWLAERRGTQMLLLIGCLGVAPSPILWTFSDNFFYLVVLQAYAGFCWGSYELGVALTLFERFQGGKLAQFSTIVNFLNSVAMVTGSALAASSFGAGAPRASDYHRVFQASSLMRLLPILLLVLLIRKFSAVKPHQLVEEPQGDDGDVEASDRAVS